MRLRDATTDDAALLADLLLAADNWTGETRVPATDLRTDPHAAPQGRVRGGAGPAGDGGTSVCAPASDPPIVVRAHILRNSGV